MLPKKGTRRIKINGDVYLWRISNRRENLNLIIQSENSDGQILTFSVAFIDAWLKIGLRQKVKETVPENEIEVIKPSFVRTIIEFALENGWTPKFKNKPYELTMRNSKISRG